MGTKPRKLTDIFEEALFPSGLYCICCGSLIDESRTYALCDKCIKQFHWITGRTCDKCGKALPDTYRGELCYDCMAGQHIFKKGYSCLTYGLHERELLMGYKYSGKGYLAKKLGEMLYDRISCEDLDVDIIVPVPIHKKRERQRGYNQAELMAKRLADLWGVPVADRGFLRTRQTPLLRSLGPEDRQSYLEGAFAVTAAGQRAIGGKRVLVVDDIYTTGATADAFSKELLKAGAGEVYLLTLASGGNRRPKGL
ncbi:MAG: ComF family protein [Bacillota bacterium]|nr:ComF family protein [Bacillota bacterium]